MPPFIDESEEGQARRQVLDMALGPLLDELKKAPKLEAELEYCFYQMILQTHKLSFTELNSAIGTLFTSAMCLYMTTLGPREIQTLTMAWLGDKIATSFPGEKKASKKVDKE